MHCREHSLEAILPFLQARNRKVSIVPILVPYLSWEQLDQLSDELSQVLAAAMTHHGWELGEDVAVVISSDAVHYGDDFDHAPFGTDADAYQRAVARDQELVHTLLEGPIRAEAQKELLHTLVDRQDPRRYRLPWCGRFSVPFGLETVRKLALKINQSAPEGTLLDYGTSLSEPELPVAEATRESGLGYTAPSNLHHWVGYAAVGYTLPPVGQ
jgi:AmmeMemoRadiSam system protein B